MMWIGLVAGALVGLIEWGWYGAVVLGFFGWLVGLIVGSMRKTSPPPPIERADPLERRVARLEEEVRELKARIGVAAWEAAMPAPVAPLPPIAEEIVSPAPVAAPAQAGAQSPPPEPPKPNPFIAWLTGGNAIARVGLVVLFTGLAFLLKYAVEHQVLPVELRVAAVAAAGVALLIFGWRLRARKPGYALGLQGGGVAVLYLTTFAALRLYGLIPAPMAFVLLAAIAVFSAFLAIAQDSLILAAFGAGGGFMAPILASTGEGNHVMLFGYYLVLNLGIAAIALYKAWRPLNVMGFVFTFVIALAWGQRSWRTDHLDTTEPFLIAFFLLYVAIAVLYARRQAPQLRNYVDGTLVFGVPLVGFGMQAAMVRHIEMAVAYSSLALAAFYIILAALLHRLRRENYRLLVESFLALGVVFLTLAVPLALDARWTSAAWALEGAAIVWVGVRQQRRLARAFGTLLQFGAGVAFAHGYRRLPEAWPLVDAPFIGALLITIAGIVTYRMLVRSRDIVGEPERQIAPFFFIWALLWWLFAGIHEIDAFLPVRFQRHAGVAFVAATALACVYLHLRRGWREPVGAAYALLPALVILAFVEFNLRRHPFGNFGWIAWPFALAVQVYVLRRFASDASHGWARGLHIGSALLLAGVAAWELHWVAATFTARGTAWSVALPAVAPAFLLYLLSARRADTRWPVTVQPVAYRVYLALILAVVLALWSLFANVTHDARSDPLPYLPLLNALDLAHILAATCVASAWLAARRTLGEVPAEWRGRGAIAIAGGLSFLWVNGVLLRSIHHWAGLPYRLEPMLRSVLVQAALSVFWSLLALGLMLYATRRGARWVWMIGAGLMAVVVAKLFILDLSQVSGIERIVSFIAVGVLMLVVGYFSPMPPRKVEAA